MSEFELEEFEPDRPDWLPGKFRTPEDLASSYLALERRMSEMGQANAAQAQAIAEQAEALGAYETVFQQLQAAEAQAQAAAQHFTPEPQYELSQSHAPGPLAEVLAGTMSQQAPEPEPDYGQQVFSMRDMKVQAQGLTGAGGRGTPLSDDQESWEKIRAAGDWSYAQLRNGG